MSAREVLAAIDVEFSHEGEVYAFSLGDENAQVVITALRAAGYALVPVEPTEAMVREMRAYLEADDKPPTKRWRWIWDVLISASKEQP